MASSGVAQDDATSAAVFDIGRHFLRVGWNHQTVAPKLSIPAMVGYPKQRAHVGMDSRSSYVGVDVAHHRSICDVFSPFAADGRVERPKDLEALFAQGFELLGATPEVTPVVVTEPLNAPRTFRNELGSILMRTFRVPSIMVVQQGVTAVFGCGATSGLALDVGEETSRAVAVVDGVGLLSTVSQTSIAGSTVTAHLQDALKRGAMSAAVTLAPALKESLCFVRDPSSSKDELDARCDREFVLPDGQPVTLSEECFTAPEVLFDTTAHRDTVGGARAPRLPDICRDTLLACDSVARDAAAPAVAPCGGTAMMPGFCDRLQYSLRSSFDIPPPVRASIALLDTPVPPGDRTWIGAAVLSSMSSSADLFVWQEQIAEQGMDALGQHRMLA